MLTNVAVSYVTVFSPLALILVFKSSKLNEISDAAWLRVIDWVW